MEKKKSQKSKARNRALTPQRREPTLRCSPTPQCGMAHRGEAEGPNWPSPRVRYNIALLCRGVDTAHNEQIFRFLFRKSGIRTPIV